MTSLDLRDRLGFTFETPYIPFPQNPKVIDYEGVDTYLYIPPHEMHKLLKNLSHKIDLGHFDAAVVNANGGWYLYDFLYRLQNFFPNTVCVEYHRSSNGYGYEVVTPVPSEYRKKKLLVFEDVYDTGGTLQGILNDAPNSEIVVAVQKIGVPNQIQIPKVTAAVKTDDFWLGGVGMNFGPGYPKDFPRNYPGLVVKIQEIIAS